MRRYLRIATTVASGTLCLLLVALWVRSYFRLDQFIRPNSTAEYVACTSAQGLMIFGKSNDPMLRTVFGAGWTRRGFAWAEWEQAGGVPFACFPSSVPRPRGREIIRWLRFKKDFYIQSGTSYEVMVPYWLLVLPAAALTAAPWIKWRFGLRTLMVAVTLLAIFLGITVALN